VNKVKGILLDFSGTLLVAKQFDLEKGLRASIFLDIIQKGHDWDEILNFAKSLDANLMSLRNQTILEYSVLSYFRIIIDYFNLRVSRPIHKLEELYFKNAVDYSPAPNVLDFLISAKDEGLKLGVISNSINTGQILEGVLSKNKLLGYFDFVMSSADYGIRKQHPLLYEIAYRKMDLNATDVIFIGDNLEYDIITAQKAGISAFWYNQKKQEKNLIIPEFEFSDWTDLSLKDIASIKES
jgi:FMN phosphatase YigB (HAD superfamily)